MTQKNAAFELVLQIGSEKSLLGSDAFRKAEDAAHISRWLYDREDVRIQAEIERHTQEQEELSSIRVQHQGSGEIISVRYPIELYENVGVFDKLLVSSAWGDCLPRPSKTIRDVSTSTSIRFEQDYICYKPNEIIYYYPAIMAMQYMTIFNHARSSYFATYSTSDETMTFHAKSVGKYDVELSVTHYPFLASGTWESPLCGKATLGGGWHPAADLYRKHMGEKLCAPQYPEWMRSSYHGWAEVFMKKEGEPARVRFAELPEIYRKIHEATGMNHLFLVGWHDRGHDTQFPRYLPCEEVGTAEELCAAVRSIHAMGGRVSLYTNARLIDIYGDFYRNGGKRAVSLDENGQEYHEYYHTASLYAVSCPGSPEYVQHMAGVAARFSGEYNVDGMFLDQISCNLDPFCFDKKHAHTKPSNNFLPGVQKELLAVREAARKCNPDYHTFVEGCHERYSQFYDVSQGHGEEYTWQIGESMPEQFLYTYKDRIVTALCSNLQQLYHGMAQFKPLDVKEGCLTDPAARRWMKRYFAFREAYGKFFFGSIFLDDEGFSAENGYSVHAVQAVDGSLALSVWNPGASDETECRCAARLPAAAASASVLPFSDAQVTVQGDRIEVSWKGALAFLELHLS